MSTLFGWCLAGQHVGSDKTTVCPGQNFDGMLVCGCKCHKTEEEVNGEETTATE